MNPLFKKISVALGIALASHTVLADHSTYHSVAAENQAIEFAPGIISTQKYFEINTVFNKAGDKVIFSRCSDDFSHCTMMESAYIKGQWQTPTALPFSGQFLDADPYFNEDFSSLYFISKRPLKAGGKATKSVNLWRSTLKNNTWQPAEYLANLSSDSEDLFPSITNNGDLYFPSFRNNDRRMYVAKANKDGFDTPVPLPKSMHGEGGKIGDSAVSRDGNTIIFSISGRKDSLGKGDLYVSHKHNGRWTLARSLGDKVNTANHEFTPIVSPDGEYLFFTRIENGKGNLYQIKLTAVGL